MRNFEKVISVILMCILLLSFAFLPLTSISTAMAQEPENMSVKMTVYPDGSVSFSGLVNQSMTGIVQSSVQFSKSGDLTKIASESSVIMTIEEAASLPFEVIDMTSSSEYDAGQYDGDVAFTITLKEEIASQFPLNATTSFSASGQCSGGNYGGVLSVQMSNFPVGRVDVNFAGNQSYVHVYGNTTVYYIMDINQTMIDGMVDSLMVMQGRAAGSLYNLTAGNFECTSLAIDRTPISAPWEGEFIDYDAEIFALNGTIFESFLAMLYSLMSGTPIYGDMSGMIAIIPLAAFSALFIMLDSCTTASFELGYTPSTRQLSMEATATMDYDVIVEKTLALVAEFLAMPTVPPEVGLLQPYLENILRQDYCHLQSSMATLHYENGVMESSGTDYIAGDVNAAVNYAKDELLDWLRNWVPFNWQLNYLDQTKLEITSFKFSYTTSSGYGVARFENLVLRPPVDSQTATSFKLKRFFNMTYDIGVPPCPFALTVEGGSNITHYVTITRPSNVPAPTSASPDGKSMTWNNPSTISGLQDLTFNVNSEPNAEGYQITDPENVSEDHPFECDAMECASAKIIIKHISKAATIVVRNMTAPPAQGDTAPEGFKFLGRYVEILCDPSDTEMEATVRIYYTDAELQAAGVDESSLKVFYWNTTSTTWEEYTTTINTTENYVEITVTHFSIWAVLGQTPSPLWIQTWFIAAIVAVIAVIVIAVAFVFLQKRKKTPQPPQPTSSPPAPPAGAGSSASN